MDLTLVGKMAGSHLAMNEFIDYFDDDIPNFWTLEHDFHMWKCKLISLLLSYLTHFYLL